MPGQVYREVNPNDTTRAIVEKAISDLEAVGFKYQGALDLLLIQSAIRMNEASLRRSMQWLASQARIVDEIIAG